MQEQDEVRIEPEISGETGHSESEIAEEESRADAKSQKLKEELSACKKERQEYLDGWQRAKADYVNALKRFESEARAAKSAGVVAAIEALLPALDALDRAKEHGEVPEGFQAIARQLESAFASLGVSPIGEKGEPFDPSMHDALGQDMVSAKDEDDRITAVLEKGWRAGEAIVRPAKVRVGHFAP